MAQPESSAGILDASFIEDHEHLYLPRDGRPAMLACGDEGTPTEDSQYDVLFAYENGVPANEGMVSIFGQTTGLALVGMTVGVAVHGPRFFDRVGGLHGLRRQIIDFMQYDSSRFAVIPAAHSDVPKERAASGAVADSPHAGHSFVLDGTSPIGCAYAANLGAIPQAITSNSLVREVGIADIAHVMGDERDADLLFSAHRLLANPLRVSPDAAYGRQDIINDGLMGLVVKRFDGGHIPAENSGVIFNHDPKSIGTTQDHYRVDSASGTLLLRRALAEHELPPRLLMTAFVLDAVPVRTLLASHDASGDHTPDPRRLAIGVRGESAEAALETIAAIETDAV